MSAQRQKQPFHIGLKLPESSRSSGFSAIRQPLLWTATRIVINSQVFFERTSFRILPPSQTSLGPRKHQMLSGQQNFSSPGVPRHDRDRRCRGSSPVTARRNLLAGIAEDAQMLSPMERSCSCRRAAPYPVRELVLRTEPQGVCG